jgi:hypothetical protein
MQNLASTPMSVGELEQRLRDEREYWTTCYLDQVRKLEMFVSAVQWRADADQADVAVLRASVGDLSEDAQRSAAAGASRLSLLEATVSQLREALQSEREDRRVELSRVERNVAGMVALRPSLEGALGATPEEGDGSLAGEVVAELRADVSQLRASALEESKGSSRSLRRLSEGLERVRSSADLAHRRISELALGQARTLDDGAQVRHPADVSEWPEKAPQSAADLASLDRTGPPAPVLDQRQEMRVASGELASLQERHVSDAGSSRTLSDSGSDSSSDSGGSDTATAVTIQLDAAGQSAHAVPVSPRTLPGSPRTLCRSYSACTVCRPISEGQQAVPDDRECRMAAANVDREDTTGTVCERVADLESRMAAAKAWELRGLEAPAGMPAAQQAMPTLLTSSRGSASLPGLHDGAKRSLQLPLGVPAGTVFARDGMSVTVAPRGMSVTTVSPRPELPTPRLVAPLVARPPGHALAPALLPSATGVIRQPSTGVIRQPSYSLQAISGTTPRLVCRP